MNVRAFLALVLVAAIAGCAAPRRPAPVVERLPGTKPAAPAPVAAPAPAAAPVERAESYTIRRGDTLYSIALDQGLDYRELAEWNGIANPDVIREGQVLRLRPGASPAGVQVNPIASSGAVQARPLPQAQAQAKAEQSGALKTEPKAVRLPYSEENVALLTRPKPEPAKPQVASVQPKPEPPKPEAPKAAQADGDEDAVDWNWPASGRILARFSDPANKGVDIAGKKGEPVYASAGGRVVYSGEGLRGYGKLIIIKHNNTFLSAYAHNDSILVKEGQSVVKGQKIAEIGSTGTSAGPRRYARARDAAGPAQRHAPARCA